MPVSARRSGGGAASAVLSFVGSRSLASLAVALVLLAAGACGASNGTPSPPASAAATPGPEALVGSWRLVTIDDGAVPPTPERTLTIAAGGAVEGNGGCNSFSGQAEIGSGTISVGPLASTRRACADPSAQDLETRYLAALESAATWAIGSAGELVVDGPSGRLTFVAG